MNITFGLSDYGKMNYMMQMADLYHEKKKLEIQMRLEPDKAAYCKRFINDVNLRGGKIMAEMQNYVKTNKSVAVVAFAQFQSMSGKEKFLKTTKVSWFNITFFAKKFADKK